MKHDEFLEGLNARGFCNTNGGECSKGKCHTEDGKHFILATDGMVIYSNDWDWNADYDGLIVKKWYLDEFDFKELDEILQQK